MKNFTDYITEELLLEKAGKAGSHLQHIEDLPFSTGDEGIEHAANILDDLDTMLSGKKKQSFNAPKAKSFVAGKFDGAPAIIFGIDPQTKRFFVASKSAFNVTPKINYTMEDIEKNHGSSPGLADKLRQALMYLPSVCPKKGIYQGDFMYDRWSIKKDDKFHEWTPNTITYRLKSNSAEGRKAFRAKFGIVVHTKYEGKTLGELQPTPYVDNENFGENPDVHLMPARVDMNPENWKPKDRADFTNALENAKILYGRMKPEAFDEVIKHSELLDLYFNEVVKGKTHTDVDEYVKFLTRQAEKEAGKLKTPARQEAVRRQFAELIKHVQVNKRHFKDAFTLRDHISKAKETLMGGLRQNTSDYEYYINGKKTGPEGYVVYRDGQDAVKLVDRKEFSKMNFELAKMKKPTFPVPSAPPIVMAFGRMNPPTGGHEGVINKVKEVAGQFGAAHEIVLSASEDPKKNPLTPEQKVKYAKKFFPGANITAATKDAPDFLTHAARVYAAGHRELIMVAGPDRIDNFRKTLAAYNGRAGKHGYYKFDHIKVVQSDRIPGKSGTEMRGYAANKDYDSFKAGLPSTATDTDVRNLYRDVKRAQQHKPVLRESYGEVHIGIGDVPKDKETLARLVPAIKRRDTGKIHIGKRGQFHDEIPKRGTWRDDSYDVGYYDPSKRKFRGYTDLDSTDLMTPVQRMRKFGNEEIEHEDEMILESGLVVARRYPDGKVKYGKPGQMHVHLVGDKDDLEDRDLGFAEPGGKFLSRDQALSHVAKHEPKIRRQLQKGKEGGLESYVYSRAREGHSVAHFFPKRRGQIREDIKRSFLHKFKNKAREYAPHTGCSDQGSSAGACAVASHAVHTALKKKGKDSHFVIGSYDEKGKHNPKGWGDNHSWVVSGNKIIDVTHNQFGKVQRGEKTKRKPSWARPMTGPAIVKTQSNDPRYRESKRDDAAIKQVRKKWPTDQRPRPDF